METIPAAEISSLWAFLSNVLLLLTAGWIAYKIVEGLFEIARNLITGIARALTTLGQTLWREKGRILGGTLLLTGAAAACVVYAVGAGEALRLSWEGWAAFGQTTVGAPVAAFASALAGSALFGLSWAGVLAAATLAGLAGAEGVSRVRAWRDENHLTYKDWVGFGTREVARLAGAPLVADDAAYWTRTYERERALHLTREAYFRKEFAKAGHGPAAWSWWKHRLVGCEEYEAYRQSIERAYRPPAGVSVSALPLDFYSRLYYFYRIRADLTTAGVEAVRQGIYRDARRYARRKQGGGRSESQRAGEQQKGRSQNGSGQNGSGQNGRQRRSGDGRRRERRRHDSGSRQSAGSQKTKGEKPPANVLKALHTLKLEPGEADCKAIKKAYREEMKRWHTDKEGGGKRQSQRVNSAYEVLTDRYDC